MFERLLIRRPLNTTQSVDVGALAEALLFYQHVDWHLNGGSLSEAVRLIGLDTLLSVFENHNVIPTFTQNISVVQSWRKGLLEYMKFGLAQLASHGQGKPTLTDEERIIEAATRGNGGTKPTARQLKRLLDAMPSNRIGRDRRPERNLGRLMDADIEKNSLLSRAARAAIEASIPGYRMPEDWQFGIRKIADEQYVAVTNYEWATLNEEYHKFVPPTHSSLTRPYIAISLFDALVDLEVAAQYGIEFMTDAKSAAVIDIKISDLLTRSVRSAEQVAAFQAMTLNDSRAIRETLNSGERRFDEFLAILERAEKFKGWLSKLEPAEGHLTHHYLQICQGSWVDTLPGRVTRFSLFNGAGALAGIINPVLGIGLSAADSFLFDGILKGWRPSQFVETSLRPFVKGK